MRTFYAIGITCLILLCGVNASAQAKENISKDDYLKGKENDSEVFVVTSDSLKHSGKKLKFPPMYFKTSEYIAVDGVRYSRKKKPDIIAYQTEDQYFTYMPSLGEDVTRIRKGKINLYTYYVFTSTPGHATSDRARRYIIEKEKNKLEVVSYELLEKSFADNDTVLQKFHELFPDQKEADKIFLKTSIPFKVERKTLESMLLLMDMYNGN